jgi:FAD/FMN-containing dehydrogenase/Fe-S oxidoreductase
MSATKLPLIAPEDLTRSIQNRPPDWRTPRVDAAALEAALKRNVEGEVRFDAGTKAMYAVDGGNYRQVPIGVVIPRSTEDVVNTVAACRNYNAPLLSRGGGTSLCGQCCNVAIVIDWSKYMNRIVELNPHQRFARVQPGVICDELRHAAAPYTLTWGPDPATHTHCTFGGMLGNNSCGAHAQMGGKAVDNTEELDILLYDGTRMTVGWMTDAEMDTKAEESGRVGQIFRNLRSLKNRYADLIEKNYPKIPRRTSGYDLDSLLIHEDGRFNLARALVGSEGTLVTILEAKVRLIDGKPERTMVVLGYPDIYAASDHLPLILEHNPIALEGVDEMLIDNLHKKGGIHQQFLNLFPDGGGWLMVEFGADKKEDAVDQAHRFIDRLKATGNAPHIKYYEDKHSQEHVWAVRESGLGATAFVPGQPWTWEGWEDSAVAPEKVGDYLRDLKQLYKKYDYIGALYGHFGQGCIHTRISFDLASAEGIAKYRSFMEEATTLVTNYGGSLSGEHGDGQSKAEFLYKMFGTELIEAFREFKAIWDPDWKMNPGKVVDPYRVDENLRLGADYHPWEPDTEFAYPDDQGKFSHAVLRCVGVGKCRRKSPKQEDSMCPSYMVTLEERHSTRGRAHHLWEMLHGGVIENGWRDEHVKESLDLCLSCKGCKGDCPVNVDMATYKAEFLSHYWKGRLRPRYAYAFGFIDKWAKLASVIPGLANLTTQLPGLSAIAKLAAGMPQQRLIPPFAPETFKAWLSKHPRRQNAGEPRVILWADTFNNYFFTETARAGLEVLEHAGFDVAVPMQHLCCGRPLYDYGFLDMARSYLQNVLTHLRPEIEAGTPMVVLEPSCCSVFRDELTEMLPHEPLAHKLKAQTFTLAEFLQNHAPHWPAPKFKRKALVHGHCHHKAIMRMKDEKAVMDKMGLDYRLLDSGCCGMAGSFGYEKDKYDVSVAIGERSLLPDVRKAGLATVLIADGFSCKEQIEQQTNRRALHLAEVIAMALHDDDGAMQMYPEARFVEPRERAIKRSMQRAAIGMGALAGGIALATWLGTRRK